MEEQEGLATPKTMKEATTPPNAPVKKRPREDDDNDENGNEREDHPGTPPTLPLDDYDENDDVALPESHADVVLPAFDVAAARN